MAGQSSSIEIDWNSGNHDTTLRNFLNLFHMFSIYGLDGAIVSLPGSPLSVLPADLGALLWSNSLSGSKSETSSWTYRTHVVVSWCKHRNDLYVSFFMYSEWNRMGAWKDAIQLDAKFCYFLNKPRHMPSSTIPTNKSPNQFHYIFVSFVRIHLHENCAISNSSLWLWRRAVMRGLPTTLATMLRTDPFQLKSCQEKTVGNPPLHGVFNLRRLHSSLFIVHFTISCLWVYYENLSWNNHGSRMLIIIVTPNFCLKSVCFLICNACHSCYLMLELLLAKAVLCNRTPPVVSLDLQAWVTEKEHGLDMFR